MHLFHGLGRSALLCSSQGGTLLGLLLLIAPACGGSAGEQDDSDSQSAATGEDDSADAGSSSQSTSADTSSGDGDSGDGDSGDGDSGDGDSGDGDSGDGDSGDGDGEPSPLLPVWDPADFSDVYEVGPGHPYADPSEVPWESIGPSTLVRIHFREAPYTDKWVINVSASEQDPVVVVGVPEDGKLPVISGDGAKTRSQLNYWNDERSVIKIGGSSSPDNAMPSWVYVQSLAIRDAHPDHSFSDEGGSSLSYVDNAAAVHVEYGQNIFVQGCEISDSGNGLFAGSETTNLVVRANYVHSNGISGSIYQHNSYTETLGITFEFNHYGALCSDCPGNNLKDRSAGTVIRYNWIEDGNRQLDLVDSDHAELVDHPLYVDTYVYGNVLVEGDGQGNSQMIHYGGDSGDTQFYRKGSLHLYHNTMVSTRSGNTTGTALSSNDQALDMRNNVVFVTANGSNLAMTNGRGDTQVRDNWLPSGWVATHEGSIEGSVEDLGNQEGAAPGFVDLDAQDFHLAAGSTAIDAAGAGAQGTDAVLWEYAAPASGVERADDMSPDIGAYERSE